MRWGVAVAVVVVAGACSFLSPRESWRATERRVDELTAQGRYREALELQQWIVAHAFERAPEEEQTPEKEARRVYRLADLYGRTGDTVRALEAYREVLRLAPDRLEDVLVGIDLLPLPEEERDAIMETFVRNALAIEPGLVLPGQDSSGCWTYRVEQVQVRRIVTRNSQEGLEKVVTYDVRPWLYDARNKTWRPEGSWRTDAGSEVLGPGRVENPRFHAMLDADGGFFAEGPIPPCHQEAWAGPYDRTRRRIFVAKRLPGS
ncbi:MAG: hypothetical protein KatS3mg076_2664 [Candidatus Binatia bacterium]|nr:MAG: hypothetical protein KatS3mg076_2664 [Candidatus Binatia bacterium]